MFHINFLFRARVCFIGCAAMCVCVFRISHLLSVATLEMENRLNKIMLERQRMTTTTKHQESSSLSLIRPPVRSVRLCLWLSVDEMPMYQMRLPIDKQNNKK